MSALELPSHRSKPRPDLTPFDLMLAGFTICEYGSGVGYCFRKPNGGDAYWWGLVFETVEEACEDARWLMTGQRGQMVLIGLG